MGKKVFSGTALPLNHHFSPGDSTGPLGTDPMAPLLCLAPSAWSILHPIKAKQEALQEPAAMPGIPPSVLHSPRHSSPLSPGWHAQSLKPQREGRTVEDTLLPCWVTRGCQIQTLKHQPNAHRTRDVFREAGRLLCSQGASFRQCSA